MRLLRIFVFALSVYCVIGNAHAGSASDKLATLADTLIKNYKVQSNGGTKAVLAVFPLNCEGKLEKQRVGFAASELMSHRFVADGTFTVVERGELAKLLFEQKLQASGVDGDTAVKLGKILGAGVILAGNIQKIGGKYQINARLVRVETAEILVSGYEELDSDVFEGDARPYLILVPGGTQFGAPD